ncbi:AraC family transcriptional regulator [Pseudomonas sp. LS44]|uniref:helix-turn-helix transcriptional regulator n=1 Tax=Pseudomonas sp. LS44 TaxID=1357074 RepID=UPI00215A98F6|nr:AraC family transcriptional regulator [Pseudomonas sp. LS44]UVE18726.1 AraC family transcriptional regulator [Pseudomonas sp. LS44]
MDDLLALGVAVERIEDVFKRSLRGLRQPFVYVPLILSRRFWDMAVKVSGDSGIGMVLGGGLISRLPHSFTYLFDVAPSLAEGFTHLVDFLPQFDGQFSAEVIYHPDEVEVRLHDCGSLLAQPPMVDFLLGGLCSLLRRKGLISGLGGSPLRRISLAHPTPLEPARHRAALQVPVEWQQPFHALHFDRDVFVRALAPGNQAMTSTLMGLIERARQNSQSTLLEVVCDHLIANLASDSSLESFCLQHHMTKRTVTRRLLTQGWRYSELLDETRRCRAADLLGTTALAMAEVTELLGYRDLPSFSRAFSRWYGISPGVWREGADRQAGN